MVLKFYTIILNNTHSYIANFRSMIGVVGELYALEVVNPLFSSIFIQKINFGNISEKILNLVAPFPKYPL